MKLWQRWRQREGGMAWLIMAAYQSASMASAWLAISGAENNLAKRS